MLRLLKYVVTKIVIPLTSVIIFVGQYRVSSPYSNFITVSFITAFFQNFPEKFGLCILSQFISLLRFFGYFGSKNCTNEIK